MPDRLLGAWSFLRALRQEMTERRHFFLRAETTQSQEVYREGLKLALDRLRNCQVAATQLEAQGDEPLQVARMRAEIARLKELYQRQSGEALLDE